MERQSDLPLFHELVHRRILCGSDHRIGDFVLFRGGDDLRVEWVHNHGPLRSDQLFVRNRGALYDPVGIVEQHPQIADASHTRVKTGRRLA